MRGTFNKELTDWKFYLKKLQLLSILLLLKFNISAQTQERLLTVTTGSFPIFLFNTLDEITTNGIEYLSYTRLNVHFEDRDAGGILTGTQWKLSVQSATPTIEGTGGNAMSLDKIFLRVESVTAGTGDIVAAPINAANYFELPGMSQDIIINGVNGAANVEVVISYRVGNPNLVAGEIPDYYMAFIEFRLQQQ
ncbi:MAG: hypothetical protein U0W24_23820 [Bacteroidales bacterium]